MEVAMTIFTIKSTILWSRGWC